MMIFSSFLWSDNEKQIYAVIRENGSTMIKGKSL